MICCALHHKGIYLDSDSYSGRGGGVKGTGGGVSVWLFYRLHVSNNCFTTSRETSAFHKLSGCSQVTGIFLLQLSQEHPGPGLEGSSLLH